MSEEMIFDELEKAIDDTKIEILRLEQELDRLNYPEDANQYYGDL